MKYIILPALALSFSLPVRAMEECDAQALGKIKALNVQAQEIIAQSADHSSLEHTDEPDQEITNFLAEALEIKQRMEDQNSK